VALTLTPGRLRALLGAVALLGIAAAWDGWQLLRAREWNARIADGSIVRATGGLPVEARFAQAWHFGRSGDMHRALALYQEVISDGNPRLAIASRYNVGNLFLREALRASRTGDAREAVPYAELAKRAYRETLRDDPGRWDARYNLERALRLMPEPEDADSGEGPQPTQSERAATTMRGFTLGLP
jgi:mxaK protein